ncbi:hypothetical protein BOTBODRAFT_172006 [Botryobasidium botryosum FD-172 SS1]|uniref:Peptidase M1 leukotriene A4 hydrolase/aminopeptidase C-terminal domain-containing protein n=1 Tax=Botryobasidium botryosum (strain FD-172 SS1) TaxID=930990 RepID=A0A067MS44_BOTB1|nr:hypothetical protein BOTBODRAFT_172006 [Botryobasidium botryosum FD-172 SS1]
MFTTSDPQSQSNYNDIATQHVHFDWTVNWANHTIFGFATHTLLVKKNHVEKVVFDTSYLDIKGVTVGGTAVEYSVKPRHEVMGSALVIPLPSPPVSGATLEVAIEYSTTDQCTAIGWLEKEQTAGKKFEYLFSQCQAIHARSLAPLQDTPSVKITYSAKVKSTLPVLLSALRISPPTVSVHNGKEVGKDIVTYEYSQPVPTPSYLIAIASGNLVYKAFTTLTTGKEHETHPMAKPWKTGVWTEPELMEKAYWEFSEDTAKFVATAEEIITPYEFGVYDLLVLPPSFPYGGMENACLTFVTPTLLAGDRSLVGVVAHEISHSWFGNNVGNADASHFWLNEGWTTYSERIITGYVRGAPYRDLAYIIGRGGLEEDLRRYQNSPRYQRLVVDYAYGEDPDDAYSRVPYEKGSNFLLYLERTLGGLEVFLPYVKDYVNTFRGKAIRTGDWKAHLFAYWRQNGGEEKIKLLDSVDWEAWFYGEGMDLPVDIKYDTSLADVAYQLAEKWDKSRSTEDVSALQFGAPDIASFGSQQIVVFLEHLRTFDPLPTTHIDHLNEVYSFNTSHNVEIRFRWYALVLASPAANKYAPDAAEWLVEKSGVKGRMKFCRSTFRVLHQVNAELARKTWEENRMYFHPIARRMIDKDLGLSA